MNFRVGNAPFTARGADDACRRRRRAVATSHACASSTRSRPTTSSLDELYGLPRGARSATGRGSALCMIASLDGTTVVDGGRAPSATPTDSAVLGALRRAADVVLVGAGTVRAEGYGPPRKPGQRIGVVTATGERRPGERAVHQRRRVPDPARGRPAGPGRSGGPARRRAGRAPAGSTWPWRCAGSTTSIDPPTFVQAEGGATLNGALLAAGCVDELDLTLSPVLAGGDGPRVVGRRAAGLDRLRARPPRSSTTRRTSTRRWTRSARQLGAPLVSSSISRWKSAAASKFL